MREMQGEVPGGQLCRRTKEKCTEDRGGGQKNGTDGLPNVFDHMGSNFQKDFIIIDFGVN